MSDSSSTLRMSTSPTARGNSVMRATFSARCDRVPPRCVSSDRGSRQAAVLSPAGAHRVRSQALAPAGRRRSWKSSRSWSSFPFVAWSPPRLDGADEVKDVGEGGVEIRPLRRLGPFDLGTLRVGGGLPIASALMTPTPVLAASVEATRRTSSGAAQLRARGAQAARGPRSTW